MAGKKGPAIKNRPARFLIKKKWGFPYVLRNFKNQKIKKLVELIFRSYNQNDNLEENSYLG